MDKKNSFVANQKKKEGEEKEKKEVDGTKREIRNGIKSYKSFGDPKNINLGKKCIKYSSSKDSVYFTD